MVTIAEIKKSGKSALEYDRSGREWLLGHPDGRIVSFPAGDEGRLAAEMSALAHDVPDVAAWIESLMASHPLESVRRRLVRAGYLIRDGHIESMRLSPLGGAYVSAIVRSATTEKKYRVWRNLTWQCQCEDWENGDRYRMGYQTKTHAPQIRGLGTMCKHCWAVLIASELELADAGAICPECNGSRMIMVQQSESFWTREECTLCSGTGRVPEEWVEPLLEPGLDPVQERFEALVAPLPGGDEPPTVACLHGPERRF